MTPAAAAPVATVLETHPTPRQRVQAHLVVHLPMGISMVMFPRRSLLTRTPARLMIPISILPAVTVLAATTEASVTSHRRRASWLAPLARAMCTVTPLSTCPTFRVLTIPICSHNYTPRITTPAVGTIPKGRAVSRCAMQSVDE